MKVHILRFSTAKQSTFQLKFIFLKRECGEEESDKMFARLDKNKKYNIKTVANLLRNEQSESKVIKYQLKKSCNVLSFYFWLVSFCRCLGKQFFRCCWAYSRFIYIFLLFHLQFSRLKSLFNTFYCLPYILQVHIFFHLFSTSLCFGVIWFSELK